MPSRYRLKPVRKSEIADLLIQSYDCIIVSGGWQNGTRASELKQFPTHYLEKYYSTNQDHQRFISSDNSQKRMDWASWELARSAIDQSIKDSAGLSIYLRAMYCPVGEDIRNQLSPPFNLKYVSSFSLQTLYFAHLHAVMSGCAIAGLIVRDRRIFARVSEIPPRWKSIRENWQDNFDGELLKMHHDKWFEKYDQIQNRQAQWLPMRTGGLISLKEKREKLTYDMEEMGGFLDQDTAKYVMSIMPEHIAFQEELLSLLNEIVSGGNWSRSYNPKPRVNSISERFVHYKELFQSCIE